MSSWRARLSGPWRVVDAFATNVSRAAAQLESTKSVVPSLVSGIDVSIHRLSVLLGEEPGVLRSELEKTSPIPTVGPEVEVGLPSDLLQRADPVDAGESQICRRFLSTHYFCRQGFVVTT